MTIPEFHVAGSLLIAASDDLPAPPPLPQTKLLDSPSNESCKHRSSDSPRSQVWHFRFWRERRPTLPLSAQPVRTESTVLEAARAITCVSCTWRMSSMGQRSYQNESKGNVS